jgi:anti-anti-sigma regulatory factor
MDTTRVLRRERVGIKCHVEDGCQFFRVRCDMASRKNLESLGELIEQALKDGKRTIVLSVTADSYLYSEFIARVVGYQRVVKQYGGEFYLVEDDPQLRMILERIGMRELVKIVPSESAALRV